MKQVYLGHVAVICLFTVLAILMTYPVVANISNSIAGVGGDPWQTLWRFEAKQHILSNPSLLAADFLGLGSPRLVNLSVWPWMPIHLLFGEPIAYNIIFLLHFILAGYAMALFVQILTRSKTIMAPAPLLAGIAYMFIPFHTAHAMGHFGAMQGEWLPFIAAIVVSYVRKQTIWKVLLFSVLFTIQAWTEHHVAFWLVGLALVAMFFYRPPIKLRDVLIGCILLSLGVLIPYIPTIRLATEQQEALALGHQQTIRFSADIFSYAIPPPWHPLWGGISTLLFSSAFTGNEIESTQYIGIIVLITVAFFHRHIPVHQKKLWLSVAALFFIISLGPVLHLFGETSIPMPYTLLKDLPIFSAIRVVSRAGFLVAFSLVTLFGWAIATNKNTKTTHLFIGALLILEFLFFPFPMQHAKLSPAYDALSQLPGSRTIEIPTATNYVAASRSLYASNIHGKEPIGNIALERGESPEKNELARTIPSIRQLLFLRTTTLLEGRDEFFGQDIYETFLDAMRWLDAKTVLVHTDSIEKGQQRAVEHFISQIPDVQKQSFGDIDIYTFPESSFLRSDGVFMIRRDGWENVQFDAKKDAFFAEVSSEAHSTIISLLSEPMPYVLSYQFDEKSQGNLTILVDGKEIHDGRFTLSPGEHDILLRHTGEGKTIIKNPAFHEDSYL